MAALEQKNEWFYCIVQDPETNQEQLMGFKDDETNTDFIPIFKTKEEAQQCFLLMPKDIMNHKYDVQAMIREDIVSQAKKTEYKIFLMNEKGLINQELVK